MIAKARELVGMFKKFYRRGFPNWVQRRFSARWHNYPFGQTCSGSKDQYLDLAKDARARCHPEIDKLENELGFAIDTKWLSDLALHTQVVIKHSEICYQHGRILYSYLSAYLRERRVRNEQDRLTILETGTARGFSSLCMAKALADAEQEGLILTFDVLPHYVPMFWNCIDDLDRPKSRSELLGEWEPLSQKYIVFIEGDSKLMLSRIQTERVHFAFFDAMHTEEDVWTEFSHVEKKQKRGDRVVFDDYSISKFPGVVGAVDELCEAFSYDVRIIEATENRSYAVATRL